MKQSGSRPANESQEPHVYSGEWGGHAWAGRSSYHDPRSLVSKKSHHPTTAPTDWSSIWQVFKGLESFLVVTETTQLDLQRLRNHWSKRWSKLDELTNILLKCWQAPQVSPASNHEGLSTAKTSANAGWWHHETPSGQQLLLEHLDFFTVSDCSVHKTSKKSRKVPIITPWSQVTMVNHHALFAAAT